MMGDLLAGALAAFTWAAWGFAVGWLSRALCEDVRYARDLHRLSAKLDLLEAALDFRERCLASRRGPE